MAEIPSNINPKSEVVSPITPTADSSLYPTHFSDFGFGGLRTVATIVERDAISTQRRVEGMLAFVEADSKYYTLASDLTTWTEFSSGGGGTSEVGRIEVIVVNNTGATITGFTSTTSPRYIYSLQDDVYDQSTNTVTLTAAKPGTTTQGQSGVFLLEQDIANGATGVGVLYGVIQDPFVFIDAGAFDYSVTNSGILSQPPNTRNHIIATGIISTTAATPNELIFNGLSVYKFVPVGGASAAQLVVSVVNNTGATINQGGMRSIENDAYDIPSQTITFTPTRLGATTSGQTGVVFIPGTILDGDTSVGILKGAISLGTGTITQEQDFMVGAGFGGVTAPVVSGAYVIATSLRSPDPTTGLEIAFDGLSNYRFVPQSGHTIEDAIGTDLAQRANLQFVGATVTDDAANDRTIVTSLAGTGGTVRFLDTQASYDAVTWAAGDFFIPIDTGIQISQAAVAAEVIITFSAIPTANEVVQVTNAILDTSLFSITGSTSTNPLFGVESSLSGVDASVSENSGFIFFDTGTNNASSGTIMATTIETLINGIATTGTNIGGSIVLTRRCTVVRNGATLTITASNPGLTTMTSNAIGGTPITQIINGEGVGTFIFNENTQYIRPSTNDGWLFPPATYAAGRLSEVFEV